MHTETPRDDHTDNGNPMADSQLASSDHLTAQSKDKIKFLSNELEDLHQTRHVVNHGSQPSQMSMIDSSYGVMSPTNDKYDVFEKIAQCQYNLDPR